MGLGQNLTTRRAQGLVFGSICQGSILGTFACPQPNGESEVRKAFFFHFTEEGNFHKHSLDQGLLKVSLGGYSQNGAWATLASRQKKQVKKTKQPVRLYAKGLILGVLAGGEYVFGLVG